MNRNFQMKVLKQKIARLIFLTEKDFYYTSLMEDIRNIAKEIVQNSEKIYNIDNPQE